MKGLPVHLQILGSFLTLQAAVLAATIVVVHRLHTSMLESAVRGQLRVTRNVFDILIQRGQAELPQRLELVLKDPELEAYRMAVRDNPGLARLSMMMLGQQLQSEVLYTNPEGLVTASTLVKVPEGTSLAGLPVVADALRGKSGMAINALAGNAYFIVASRRPRGGAVVLPTLLGEEAVRSMQELTGAGISVGAKGRVTATTLPPASAADLQEALPSLRSGASSLVGPKGRRQLVIPASVSDEVMVFLHTDWDEALKPLAALKRRLLLIGLSGIFLTALAGLLIAKGITEAMRRLIDSLRLLDRLKTKFFMAVTHDVKGPLTAVSTGAELLCGRPLAEKDARAAAMIRQAATTLDFLVSDLVDFAAIEAGKLRVQLQPMDLAKVVSALAQRMKAAAQEREIGFVVRGLPGVLPMTGDPKRLEQMLQNLCSNAINCTRAGGDVTLEVDREREAVHLTVRDTGIGIAPEDLGRIFEPYFQAEGAKRLRDGGFGIGLTIAREIAEAHGGSIRVESEPERGSAFRVTLPIGRPHVPQAAAKGRSSA